MTHPQNFDIVLSDKNEFDTIINNILVDLSIDIDADIIEAEKKRSTKQVIVMRTDLNMRKGKMCAQAAHASMKVFFGEDQQNILTGKIVKSTSTEWQFIFGKSTAMYQWLNGLFTKITVGISSEKELLYLCKKAYDMNIPAALIRDAGITEFKEPTITCAAFGPWWSDELDDITGHLKLI